MSKAQLVITAVVLEGRSKSDVARDYEVSRQWLHDLVRRYTTEGAAAYVARPHRPHTNRRAVGAELEECIIELRKTLSKQGYDAGAQTIAEHLARDAGVTEVPAVATIWRILSRRGFITPCRIVRRSAADQRCRRGPDVGARGARRSGGGRPIADDRLDVELALLVCEWYGNAVLSADGA